MASSHKIFVLGFFDGVHLGHQALLKACCGLAAEMGCETAAITFEDHPKTLFSGPIPLISTVVDRCRLLAYYGMDRVYTYPVTQAVMGKSWEVFLEELLEEGAAGFVCGDDFRFGKQGLGNAEKLRTFCQERGLPCAVLPEQSLGGVRISSTYIRRQIQTGDMATAVRFLGHPYLLTGTVVPGKQLGRLLGVPTANLRLPEELTIPQFGVYACLCRVDEKVYAAVTNVGTRPTVSGSGITVEPWILDYEGDLYGREITLEFYKFLRPEQKFPSVEELRAQILRDAEATRQELLGRKTMGY